MISGQRFPSGLRFQRVCVCSRLPRDSACYGLRGIRIGEASNPGPTMENTERILQPGNAANASVTCILDLAQQTAPWLTDGTIPARVVSQTWSPLYVPLLWAAVEQKPSHPLVEWLELVCEDLQDVGPRHAWEVLRRWLRDMSITDAPSFSRWLIERGLSHGNLRTGSHLRRSIQEFVLDTAAREVIEVVQLQESFVAATRLLAGQPQLRQELRTNLDLRRWGQTSTEPQHGDAGGATEAAAAQPTPLATQAVTTEGSSRMPARSRPGWSRRPDRLPAEPLWLPGSCWMLSTCIRSSTREGS